VSVHFLGEGNRKEEGGRREGIIGKDLLISYCY